MAGKNFTVRVDTSLMLDVDQHVLENRASGRGARSRGAMWVEDRQGRKILENIFPRLPADLRRVVDRTGWQKQTTD